MMANALKSAVLLLGTCLSLLVDESREVSKGRIHAKHYNIKLDNCPQDEWTVYGWKCLCYNYDHDKGCLEKIRRADSPDGDAA